MTAALTRWLAAGGRYMVVASDALGGDPAPDQPRQLRVEYDEGGQPQAATVSEGQPLTFTGVSHPVRYLRRAFTAHGPVSMVIRPRPGGGIESVDASRQTMYGEVVSRWTCREALVPVERVCILGTARWSAAGRAARAC